MRFLVLFLIVSHDSSFLTLSVVCSPSLFSLIVVASSEKRPTDARGTNENERRRDDVTNRDETIKDDATEERERL
jgi:hypothetical protein